MKYCISFLIIISTFLATAQKSILIVGTYTTGKSQGIHTYKFDNATGDIVALDSIKSKNPSYVTVSKNKKYVYAVNEEGNNNGIGGSVSAYKLDVQTGKLIFINTELSGGDHPCYVAIDKTGKWLTVGNYNGGNIGVMPLQENGAVGKAVMTQHKGSSVNIARQTKAHVHCTYFSANNKFLYVPDLGMDKVMIYNFNEKDGSLSPTKQAFAKSDTGAGPRHITFSKNEKFAYLMEELTATVNVSKQNNGELTSIQKIKATPESFTGKQGSADIHLSPDGNFLYCSNRGESNSITIFKIDKKTGLLTYVDNTPSLGLTPRNFTIDNTGKFLLVAHQKSDNIVIFKIDKLTGLLTDTGKRIDVGNPVCLKLVELK